MFQNNFFFILPELFLMVSILFLLIFGVSCEKNIFNENRAVFSVNISQVLIILNLLVLFNLGIIIANMLNFVDAVFIVQ